MSAALVCFTRMGYNNTTMDDIATECGVSKGTLYWYFESKDSLLESVITAFIEDSYSEPAIAALAEVPTAAGKLRTLARAMAALGERAQGFFSLFLEYWASSPHRDETARLWVDLLVEYKEIVAEVIQEGIKNNEFKPVDAESLVWAIMAAYDGLAAYKALTPALDTERVSRAFVEALLGGLVVDEQESRR
ncbi:MAG: TetR/AcrR family transcriptional regulator [Anaerolineae bacterium]|nr:TetR/AcrR family transcriptional regulator [Anaerolineae bacterium]